ncbi:MAG: monovalent cation:H+ antiporter-2, family, partial [Thermoplasmata archaeon]|nr:monovalent cation:H+ antiporter-2, family [Thermoplasmata archaeon]
MSVDFHVLLELCVVALGAVAGGWACRRMGLPEVLGYLLAGVLLGPTLHPGGFVSSDLIQDIMYFAVVFRMFILGLDFDARRLKGRWGPALAAGGLEMALSTAAGMGLALLLGWPLLHGAILGAALGTTSTSILSKALADRNLSAREDARAAGAATLAEDLLSMGLVATLGLWVGATPNGTFDFAALGKSATEMLVFASLAFTAGAVLMPIFIDRLSKSRSEELLTLAVVAVLFGFAALSEFLHAGRPVGAFLAGIAVGAARHAPALSARMLPLRDLFAVTSYVGMGLLLSPTHIREMLPYALVAVPLFVLIKVVSVGVGLRLGGVPAVTAARAGAILGQSGTMGIVFACAFFLNDADALGRLAAFAFLGWILTVALTGLRLRYLPDAAERVARLLGARDLTDPSHRLPRGRDAEARANLRLAVLALGCAAALAALAGLAALGAELALVDRLVPPAAAAAGFVAALFALPFALLVALGLRDAAHVGVHRAALRPTHLAAGRAEGARSWGAVGGALGLAVALTATAGMAWAVAPPDARLWVMAGAALAGVVLVARLRWMRALVARCAELLSPRREQDARLHDFRGASPFGYDVEAVLVRAGTRAAWARPNDLDLKRRTGASLVAVVRPGTQASLPLDKPIPPGAEVVVGGTAAQIVAAKKLLLEAQADAPPAAGAGHGS